MAKKQLRSFDVMGGSICEFIPFQSVHGISVVHFMTPIDGLTCWHRLKMSPRMYPYEWREKVGEQANPGSFASGWFFNIRDLQCQLNFAHGIWLPSATVTVPMEPMSISLTGSVTDELSPELKLATTGAVKGASLGGNLAIFKGFTQVMADVSAAKQIGGTRLGVQVSSGMSSQTLAVRLVSDFRLRPHRRAGLMLSLEPRGPEMAMRVQQRFGKTIAGIGFQFVPHQLASGLTMAVQRHFNMSTLQLGATTTGNLKSVFTRKLSANMELACISDVDLLAERYNFGLALQIVT